VPERIEDLDLTISFFAQDRRKFPVSQADKESRRYRVFEKHGELILEQLKRRPDPNQ